MGNITGFIRVSEIREKSGNFILVRENGLFSWKSGKIDLLCRNIFGQLHKNVKTSAENYFESFKCFNVKLFWHFSNFAMKCQNSEKFSAPCIVRAGEGKVREIYVPKPVWTLYNHLFCFPIICTVSQNNHIITVKHWIVGLKCVFLHFWSKTFFAVWLRLRPNSFVLIVLK